MINTQLNVINKLLSYTEPRSEIKFLKRKRRIRQLPGCDHGAMIEKIILIQGDESIVPSNKKIKGCCYD